MRRPDLAAQIKPQTGGLLQGCTHQDDMGLLMGYGLQDGHALGLDPRDLELAVLRQRLGQQLAAHPRAVGSQNPDPLRGIRSRNHMLSHSFLLLL